MLMFGYYISFFQLKKLNKIFYIFNSGGLRNYSDNLPVKKINNLINKYYLKPANF